MKLEDCVRPGTIFRPYRWKNGWWKHYLPFAWTEDCVSRCYFLSAKT